MTITLIIRINREFLIMAIIIVTVIVCTAEQNVHILHLQQRVYRPCSEQNNDQTLATTLSRHIPYWMSSDKKRVSCWQSCNASTFFAPARCNRHQMNHSWKRKLSVIHLYTDLIRYLCMYTEHASGVVPHVWDTFYVSEHTNKKLMNIQISHVHSWKAATLHYPNDRHGAWSWIF
jgi:hypothetical protein